ncbi:MAG: DNA mismatch repair endonuclease MutL [Evtepia gabavorous]
MPNQIQVLDPHVADLIAAGEVVERPASVVKELVENAVDAGAHTLTVEIQRGGMAMIRVTDDGGGIPTDQCQTAFLRHATSKLRTAQDLAAIGTLGFRGEALAAIAAVSRVELFTRTAQCDLGPPSPWRGARCSPRSLPAARWAPPWWCGTCFTTPPPG